MKRSAVALPLACLLALAGHAQAAVFINELHYDNAGAAGESGEGVEIVATAGESLSGYKVYLYNGSNPGSAAVYATTAVPAGSLVNCGGQVHIATFGYPQALAPHWKARRRMAAGPLLPCAASRPPGISRGGSVRRRTARQQARPRARGHRTPARNQAPADLYSRPNQARQSPAGVPILSAACLRPHSVCCSAPAPIRPAPRGSPRSWSKNGWPRA
ncbi:hypothetical protein XTPLMG730_3436 [Xanthomonas translucens pv. phlei]|uniref:Uncharacterized protein n=1 Tax=Xanthomonas graminis pv. phlei TaxID=487906 RepID=A0A0K3A2F6_9XANT|nr:hypothetical protein XTPLMG730_3436 [Xanthomonas translucens pv. phlei]